MPLETGRIQPLALGCASKCKASPMASSRWATQPLRYSILIGTPQTLLGPLGTLPKPPGRLPENAEFSCLVSPRPGPPWPRSGPSLAPSFFLWPVQKNAVTGPGSPPAWAPTPLQSPPPPFLAHGASCTQRTESGILHVLKQLSMLVYACRAISSFLSFLWDAWPSYLLPRSLVPWFPLATACPPSTG